MLALTLLTVVAATPLETGWSWRKGDLPVTDARAEVPTDGWLALEGSGSLRRSSTDDVTMWLRNRLPATMERDAALALNTVIGHFEVFVDGQRIYSFPPKLGVDGHGMNGLSWHLVSLPEGAEGKELLVRVRSTYTLAGIQGVPLVTTRAEFFESLVRDDSPRFVIGCLLVLLSALMLAALRGAGRNVAASLAVYAASAGTYVLFYSRLKQLLLPIPPPLWMFLYVLSIAVIPAMYFFIIEGLFETKSVWMRRWRVFHVAIGGGFVAVSLVLWAVLELLDSPSAGAPVGYVFFAASTVQRVSMLISSIGSTAILVQWARGRGAASDVVRARILLAGVAVLLTAMWLNVWAATGLGNWAGNFVPMGMVGLTLSLAVLAQRAWRESHERAVTSERALTVRAREKEAMLRDLHDGIGSVTTNIRMLAELGRRDEKRAAESLATIAELSSEGISELRTFIQSLDENQVDWPLLSAELRRFGGQLIESQGMQFQLDAELSENAPRPSGAVTLALLRIFREALTNVVKHAGAHHVRARLSVSPTRLTLEVHDDGAGSATPTLGLDTGRGLRNMRARAEELGGEFQFAREGGTTLSVSLPLQQLN